LDTSTIDRDYRLLDNVSIAHVLGLGLLSAVMGKPRKNSLASQLIGLAGHPRVAADILKARMAERDQRQATDNRSELEKFFGDPPANRSALGTHGAAMPRWVYYDIKQRRPRKGWG
jgi:hypothetical protein